MEGVISGGLSGSEIHGFRTMQDLDIGNMMEEAKTRWLRPNEIHAILSNYKYFHVKMKPVNLPKSGTIVLFDRKMLRNFRKDGHNWKKKKDGKTVKEAHEHLKVGNEERIHVYYAHGEDNSTFVRRCYWLLDKSLEHVVLVHYRETQELQGSPVTPGNSTSSSALSDPSASWNLSEETDSGVDQAYLTSGKPHLEPNETIKNHEMRLHEINTLEWDELVVPDDSNKLITPEGGTGNVTCFDELNQYKRNGYGNDTLVGNGTTLQGDLTVANTIPAENSSSTYLPGLVGGGNSIDFSVANDVYFQTVGGQIDLNSRRKDSGLVMTVDSLDKMGEDGLRTQDSFGRWMNYIVTDTPGSIDDTNPTAKSLYSTDQESFRTPIVDHGRSPSPEQIFSITDISPSWAFSNEDAKILIVGFFHEEHQHLAKSNLFCVCGDVCVPAEVVQSGVFRCFVSPHDPGLFNLYLSYDGYKPISQVVAFEYRTPPTHNFMASSEDKSDSEEFRVQMRLARLLFSTSNSLNILCSKVSPKTLKEAKMFAVRTAHIVDCWEYLIKYTGDKNSFPQAKKSLFELTLQNKLREWLLERIVEGSKLTGRDDEGQGVIHLCAILDYTWAVYLFSVSGLSVDYRDKFGWTALHWAAYYGREKMVATLLSAGAKPNLVTDPTKENPGGYTPADLASKRGYEGLGAYLAEKSLVAHFEDMSIAGNVSGSLQSTFPTTEESTVNAQGTPFSEEELYLKDTLSAYRTAADAAARIQAAFREQSYKLQKKAVQFSNPEEEARSIIAAMKIQHAFRNHETRKQMAAAARIQHRFRTWKIRKDFLNMRRQAVKIQSIFRGFQVRRQYRKIIFAVGVLEKAILRWRLKRKGFRGLQVSPNENVKDEAQESNGVEDFYHASRKQAEERVERSVVRVQAMFRSKQAQEEYRRMKLSHNQAQLDYEELLYPVSDMER